MLKGVAVAVVLRALPVLAPRGLGPHRERILQALLRELLDSPSLKGCGEKHHLRALGDRRDNLEDIRPEAHVEHAVRLVNHHYPHVPAVKEADAPVLEEPPRGRHNYLGARRKGLLLPVVALAADYGRGAEPEILPEARELGNGLQRYLAGRGDDEDRRRSGTPPHRAVDEQLQRGNDKGAGLACSGRRLGHDVAPEERFGDDLLLYGGRLPPAGVSHR